MHCLSHVRGYKYFMWFSRDGSPENGEITDDRSRDGME